MNDEYGFIIVIMACLLTGCIFGAITQCSVDNSWRDQIVNHGCAKYYLDDNNKRQWNWSQ